MGIAISQQGRRNEPPLLADFRPATMCRRAGSNSITVLTTNWPPRIPVSVPSRGDLIPEGVGTESRRCVQDQPHSPVVVGLLPVGDQRLLVHGSGRLDAEEIEHRGRDGAEDSILAQDAPPER